MASFFSNRFAPDPAEYMDVDLDETQRGIKRKLNDEVVPLPFKQPKTCSGNQSTVISPLSRKSITAKRRLKKPEIMTKEMEKVMEMRKQKKKVKTKSKKKSKKTKPKRKPKSKKKKQKVTKKAKKIKRKNKQENRKAIAIKLKKHKAAKARQAALNKAAANIFL